MFKKAPLLIVLAELGVAFVFVATVDGDDCLFVYLKLLTVSILLLFSVDSVVLILLLKLVFEANGESFFRDVCLFKLLGVNSLFKLINSLLLLILILLTPLEG